MRIADLIGRLREHGAALVLNGDRVRCQGAAEVLTPEVLQALRAHKAAIVDALSRECHGTPGPCERCGRAARPEVGAERLSSGELVCGDCVTTEDVEAGSVPLPPPRGSFPPVQGAGYRLRQRAPSVVQSDPKLGYPPRRERCNAWD